MSVKLHFISEETTIKLKYNWNWNFNFLSYLCKLHLFFKTVYIAYICKKSEEYTSIWHTSREHSYILFLSVTSVWTYGMCWPNCWTICNYIDVLPFFQSFLPILRAPLSHTEARVGFHSLKVLLAGRCQSIPLKF